MPTLLFCCGAECGIAAIGAAPGTGGVRHWDVVTGTAAIDAVVFRSGARSYKFTSAANSAYLQKTLAATNMFVGRAYIRFNSLPTGNALISACPTAGSWPFIAFRASDGKIGLTSAGSTMSDFVGAVAVVAGQWYRLDWRFNLSANPWTLQLQVDGINAIQIQPAIAATTMTSFRIGSNVDTGQTPTYILNVDDIAFGVTSGDYPLGAGKTVGLFPSSDGTHVYGTAGDFKYNNLTNVPLAATDTWTYIDDLLDNITDFLAVVTASITEYLEWNFGDLGSDVTSINGIQVTMASHSATTTANKQTLRLNDNGTLNDVCTDLDQSQTTITFHSKHYALSPNTGLAWTKTRVDALRMRWNSSYGTVDESPVPFVDAIVIEVDYVSTQINDVLTAAAGVYGVVGNASTPKLATAMPASTGVYAQTGNAAGSTAQFKVVSVTGIYNFIGNDAILIYTPATLVNDVMVAATGVYAVTGFDAGLKAAIGFVADTGAFGVTGSPASPTSVLTLPAVAGSYALVGSAMSMTGAFQIPAETGEYALVGNAAALLNSGSVNYVLIAATGVYVVTGVAPLLNANVPFTYVHGTDDFDIYVRDVTADTTLIKATSQGGLLTDAPIKRDTVFTEQTVNPPASQFDPV